MDFLELSVMNYHATPLHATTNKLSNLPLQWFYWCQNLTRSWADRFSFSIPMDSFVANVTSSWRKLGVNIGPAAAGPAGPVPAPLFYRSASGVEAPKCSFRTWRSHVKSSLIWSEYIHCLYNSILNLYLAEHGNVSTLLSSYIERKSYCILF